MISLVAAISENNCIGVNGAVPWYLPEDMARMKALTFGKVVIMGRKTWESIPHAFRPLPDRTNVVITRQENYPLPPGVERYHSVEAAMAAHAGEDTVSFGGTAIYAAMLPHADVLYITRVHRHIDGDTFFPDVDWSAWKETGREAHNGYTFFTYTRTRS